VYVEHNLLYISAFYERNMPISKQISIVAGSGIMQGVANSTETNFTGKLAFILGKEKHFFEMGTVVKLAALPEREKPAYVMPVTAYRFQAPGGLQLRAGFTFVLPGISIGYSF